MKNAVFALILIPAVLTGCTQTPKKARNVSYLREIKTRTLDARSADAVCVFGAAQKRLAWQKVLAIGNRCWKDRKWTELAAVAAHLRQSHAEGPWGFLYQSVIDEQGGKTASALWMIQRALELAPDQEALLYQKARLLWRLQEPSEAVKLLRRTLRKNPKLVPAHAFLAELMWSQGHQKGALEQVEAALRIEPDNRELRELHARYTADGKQKVARVEKTAEREEEK